MKLLKQNKKYTLHPLKVYNLVMQLRNKNKWGATRISNYLRQIDIEISKGTVQGLVYKKKEPFVKKIMTQLPKESSKLTKEKAYVLGALCGDGYISTGYRIGLSVCDKEFAEYFKNCLIKVYHVNSSLSIRKRNYTNYSTQPKIQYIVSCISKLVVKDLERYSKSFKSRDWKLPIQIKNSSLEFKAAFLRGFVDSEAHVRYRKGQSEINICSGNLEGLKQIRKLLFFNFDIKTYLGNNGSDIPVIVVTKYNSLLRFYKNIGFVIIRKQKSLEKALNSYKRKGIRRYPESFKIKAMNLLKKGYKHRQIAKILNTNHTNIYDWEKKYL